MDSELGFSLGGQQSQAEIQAQLDFFRARAAGILKQSVYIAAALWSSKYFSNMEIWRFMTFANDITLVPFAFDLVKGRF